MFLTKVPSGIAVKSVGYAAPVDFTGVSERAEGTSPGNDPQQVQTARAILWAVELMYFPALGCVKLSFLFFYRRIFSKGRGLPFRVFTLSVIIMVIIWIVGFFFSYLVACKSHAEYNWTSLTLSNHYCLDATKLHLGYSISDFLLDAVIIAIPIPLVWQLHMSLLRKLAVLGIFALGALSFAASITRMLEYIQRSRFGNLDIDFVATNAIYWCILEVGVGLIAACLPSLYGLFKTHALQRVVKVARMTSTWIASKTGYHRRVPPASTHSFNQLPLTHEPTLSPIQIVVQREFEIRKDFARGWNK